MVPVWIDGSICRCSRIPSPFLLSGLEFFFYQNCQGNGQDVVYRAPCVSEQKYLLLSGLCVASYQEGQECSKNFGVENDLDCLIGGILPRDTCSDTQKFAYLRA